jgi:NADH-quinone oxidoreductase subunit M
VIGILYGGLTALAQNDLKKLVAYSSVGHMGFATLGIFVAQRTQGVEGAVLVMINHGVTTGALFICVGLLYERLHTRELSAVAGVGKLMPVFTGFFGVFCAVLAGLSPARTASSASSSCWRAASPTPSWITICVVPGVVLAAAYMLRVLQRVAFGGTQQSGA